MLFLEYEFIAVHKHGRTHVVDDVLSRLWDNSEPLGVLDQNVDASFFVEPTWMQGKNPFRDKSDVKNSKLSSKIEVG